MRTPRFQFTVRRMMVLVAIVGVVLGAGLWSARMVRLSRAYALQRDISAHYAGVYRMQPGARYRPRYAHWAARLAKYERAARYPWLPVAPDPPEPK